MALKDKYFTVTQTAKKLNVTRQTVYRWITSKQLDAEKIGRELLISMQSLNDFEEKLLYRSIGGFILNRLDDYIQHRLTEDTLNLGSIEKIDHDPEKLLYSYLVTDKDGSRRKVTFEYQGFEEAEDPKAPDIIKLTVILKTKTHEISGKEGKTKKSQNRGVALTRHSSVAVRGGVA